LCTAYKVYAEMLRNRIEKEVERKGMISESQAGFRKGRATLDNVFVLNHVMQREKRYGGEDGKKIYPILKPPRKYLVREKLSVIEGH